MEIVIRHAEPDDYRGMHRIFEGVHAVAGTLQLPYQSAERWRSRLANASEGRYSLVACVDGEIVGSLGLGTVDRPRRRHVADLGMAVRDDWHGKGVGTALMRAAIDLADNWLNVERIELTVYTDNVPAIALYQRFGFEIEGTHRRYAFREGGYVDAHTMARLRPERDENDRVSSTGNPFPLRRDLSS
ncbi:MAG TPA: GNAT family N-acetyltransferase [Herpetosiphonaceae bacterium]|jgi:putative acetyltransferase|nr:GNAT family N-acetyltransferase [Herpetosiphonaceae bacterium]